MYTVFFIQETDLYINVHNILYCKAGGTNILLVRPAYSYSIVLIVLIVFVLKALIN